jgi:hypothetical protein
MKISKTPSLLIALTLTSMIAGGCALDDTETDLETDDDAEIGEIDLGEFEGAAARLQRDCGNVTCHLRLNRALTKKVAGMGDAADVAELLCSQVANAAAAAICHAAVLEARFVIHRANTYYKEGNCLGIRHNRFAEVLPVKAGFPVRVKINTFNCGPSKARQPRAGDGGGFNVD